MEPDVDLLRDLMLSLEQQQQSPRMTIVISVDDEAADLGRPPEDVGAGLDRLLELDYIDGPGREDQGYWLFRKLTRKGAQFVRQTRSPADWARLKRRYAL